MFIASGLRRPSGFYGVGEGWSVWSLVFSASSAGFFACWLFRFLGCG